MYPFRRGNDDIFQSSIKEETVYDAIGGAPDNSYDVEVSKYNQWRWNRGMIQNIIPVTTLGFLTGFGFGVRQSRLDGRYQGRARVLARYCGAGTGIGLAVSSVHHGLVMRNRYEDKWFYPMLSSMTGSVLLAAFASYHNIALGVYTGSVVGVIYTAVCWGSRYYHNRHIRLFLESQRQLEVPVHKISPELQPAYRAYLFDFRPVEEQSQAKRRATIIARREDDYRLDAAGFLNNMTPEVYDWVSFPDWWPLKNPAQTEEQTMLIIRQRQEASDRRFKNMMTVDDGKMMKRTFRFKSARET